MSDVEIGLGLMLLAVVGAGVVVGYELSKGDQSPHHVPRATYFAIFVYYVGSVMWYSAITQPTPPSSHYAMGLVLFGLIAATGVAVLVYFCIWLFRTCVRRHIRKASQ